MGEAPRDSSLQYFHVYWWYAILGLVYLVKIVSLTEPGAHLINYELASKLWDPLSYTSS